MQNAPCLIIINSIDRGLPDRPADRPESETITDQYTYLDEDSIHENNSFFLTIDV